MEVLPDGPAGQGSLGDTAWASPRTLLSGVTGSAKGALPISKRLGELERGTPGGMFRPKGMNGLLMWVPRFPLAHVGSPPGGETPQNHRDQTDANVLFHSSPLSKLSDHLLLRLSHLYNRKTANGRRQYGANRLTDEGTLTIQN